MKHTRSITVAGTLALSAPFALAQVALAPTLAAQQRLKTANLTMTMTPLGDGKPDSTSAAVAQVAQAVGAQTKSGLRLGYFLMAEHLPNPDSRITLGEAKDALGLPRPRLEWRYTDADWRSLERTADALADELGAARAARMCWPAKWAELVAISNASRHHMGTTRMATSAGKGVVDPDGKVFGVDNLYVAGSSVFPTSGLINPTLTLLALAMRLSDHLTTRFGARQ